MEKAEQNRKQKQTGLSKKSRTAVIVVRVIDKNMNYLSLVGGICLK
jgi:hypothetical protein